MHAASRCLVYVCRYGWSGPCEGAGASWRWGLGTRLGAGARGDGGASCQHGIECLLAGHALASCPAVMGAPTGGGASIWSCHEPGRRAPTMLAPVLPIAPEPLALRLDLMFQFFNPSKHCEHCELMLGALAPLSGIDISLLSGSLCYALRTVEEFSRYPVCALGTRYTLCKACCFSRCALRTTTAWSASAGDSAGLLSQRALSWGRPPRLLPQAWLSQVRLCRPKLRTLTLVHASLAAYCAAAV